MALFPTELHICFQIEIITMFHLLLDVLCPVLSSGLVHSICSECD